MKTNVRDSSLDAREEMKFKGMQHRQQQILAAIRLLLRTGQAVDGWVSRRQIARASGLETSCVSGRVNDMVGSVLEEREDTQPCPVTGRAVHLVRIREWDSVA